MAHPHSAEKLHAACDECRSRKLKCSGEKPVCGRCSREEVACVYSRQKTMGRPRKRRREDGADADAAPEQPGTSLNGHDSGLNGFATPTGLSSFGLVSPPEFADLPRAGASEASAQAQAQLDPGLVGMYAASPPTTDFDLGLTPPLDPSLWAPQVPPSSYQPSPPAHTALGPCTCLSLTYLTLTDLQTVPTFSFPQVIVPLRKAMRAITSLTHCATCPQDLFSALQNVSALASLFKALTARFSKALHEIDVEAARLLAVGGKKAYRMGANDPALAHLHTGTLDCPMGFNVELEPGVWKALVKGALKTEVHGGGGNERPLMRLLEEVEERQRRWHADDEFLAEERRRMWGREQCERNKSACEGFGGEQIRRTIGMLEWE